VSQHSWLNQKRVILGVTGGIACYKACEIARELGRLGADVTVVMTEAATAFVTPLTFQALTGNTVRHSLLDPKSEAGMGHIELARWADLILVAPCTANTIAHLARGDATDLLSALWLAADCPKALAPAMNQNMWANPATQANLETLRERHTHMIGPDSGLQACGDVGLGRMSEPSIILAALESQLQAGPLAGLTVMITAGPTHEPIDPVRYLTNRSSGKMGFAIARAAVRLGARVLLVSGPVDLDTPDGVIHIAVETARDMLEAVKSTLKTVDLFIGAAAVCDIRPETVATHKLKKTTSNLSMLALIENPDVIHQVALSEERPKLVVGFAAETEMIETHARRKLEDKGLDFIIANDVSNGQIFNADDTKIQLVSHSHTEEWPQGSKEAIAEQLMQRLSESLLERTENGTKI
jgi:phosphopantothenoylcysteine decarboxylase/phosphopantothenate--cysteine ligase